VTHPSVHDSSSDTFIKQKFNQNRNIITPRSSYETTIQQQSFDKPEIEIQKGFNQITGCDFCGKKVSLIFLFYRF